MDENIQCKCCDEHTEKILQLTVLVDELKSEIDFIKKYLNSEEITLKKKLNEDGEIKEEIIKESNETVKIYKNKDNFDIIKFDEKSYKNPVLDFMNSEMMVSLFFAHTEKLPFILFRFIYFASEPAENRTIKMPKKGSIAPRFLEVCDYGEWHQAKTHDVIVEVNKIVCGLINTYLTKGNVYIGLEMSDKKLIADIVCKRFEKKLSAEIVKNYMSALY